MDIHMDMVEKDGIFDKIVEERTVMMSSAYEKSECRDLLF